MTRSTGWGYLSWTRGPGDYTSLIDEREWLFEFGFYAAGRYFFLREEPSRLARVRPLAGGYGLLMIILGMLLVTLGSSGAIRLIGFCLALPGAIFWVWGSKA